MRKVSFTGSTGIGERITPLAGVKKLSLELGASCPVVILPDADLELASSAVAAGGFVNAGQVCISVQRVIAHPAIDGDFLDALVPKVEAIAVGDPSSADTRLGTLITDSGGRAGRARRSRAAAHAGARVLTGGERDGAVVAPAVVADVDPRSPFSQDELFGPAVAVSTADGLASRPSPRPTAPPTGSAPGSSPATSPARSGPCGRSTPATSTSTGRRCGGPT